MGFSLSPVLANLFLEQFKKETLASAALQPTSWIDISDYLVIWAHGKDKLKDFQKYLNMDATSLWRGKSTFKCFG